MQLNGIMLNDLITDEKYNHLIRFNLIVKNVKVIQSSMDMIIDIIAPKEFINDNAEIENMFKTIFDNFKIVVNINFHENLTLNKDNLTHYITDTILKNITSSKTWVNDIIWEIEDDLISLRLPNPMSYFSMERIGLINILDQSVNNEIGKKLKVSYNDNTIDSDENFLEENEIEERIISKKILLNKPTDSKYNDLYSYGKFIKDKPMSIRDIDLQSGEVVVKGRIFGIDTRIIKGNKTLVLFNVSDESDSITVKTFLDVDRSREFLDNLKEDSYVLLEGDVTYDTFYKCTTIILRSLMKLIRENRADIEDKKRVELHLHTQMSAMDGVSNVKKLIARAKEWGHKAIAITDHGVVQAFPDAMEMSRKLDIKILYGVEGYMINDNKKIVTNFSEDREANDFVVFDLETTGLSAKNDRITEIGAIRIVDGEVKARFSQLINPERPIPPYITELTA